VIRRLTRTILITLAITSLLVVPTGRAGAQTTTAQQPLKIASTMADDLTPILYAIKAGFFKRAGLDVDLTVLPSGAAVAAAVAGGAIDIGKSSLVSLMNAHMHGVPIELVAAGGMYDANAPYAELVIASDAPFKTGKDLNGKTIGVPALGDFNVLVSSMWVDQNGGDSKTLKFVEVPNTPQAAAVADHRIDAAVLQQPDLSLSLETGKVKVLGLDYSAISPSFMFTGWFAKNDWAAAHPDLVKTFARVAVEAARYTNAHHAETAQLLADASKIPLATIQKMARTDSSLTVTPAMIQSTIDASFKYKLLPKTFPASELIFTP
jgi:NitT/TauT family transport system substrate-binding protein